MARPLTTKQREHARRQAGDGRDVMIWDAGDHFRASEVHAALVIPRLRSLGYEASALRTFPSKGPRGQWIRITEFDVTFREEQRVRVAARIRAGQERAKAAGRHIGRPRIDADRVQHITALLAQGDLSLRAVATAAGVGRGTVARCRDTMRASAPTSGPDVR